MALKYLLDSVIIIDHLNGVTKASVWLEKLKEGQAAISVVTRAEVLVGIDQDQLRAFVKILLSEYQCLGIKEATADLASDLRRINKWLLPDAFQVAIAKEHGIKLITRNTKDFQEKKHDFVKIPYRI